MQHNGLSIIDEKHLPILKENGAILNHVLQKACTYICDSIQSGYPATELEIDNYVHRKILAFDAKPACLNYNGFPNSLCISVNDTLVHGIPSDREFKVTDIVSLDCAIEKNGFFVDKAMSFIPEYELCKDGKGHFRTNPAYYYITVAANAALDASIEVSKVGNTIGDIANKTQTVVESMGYNVCTEFTGHGIGVGFHMLPAIPNYGIKGRGDKIVPGLTIAIEPMVIGGPRDVYTKEDGWTIKTVSGAMSAHVEDTVYVSEEGPIIITREELKS